MGVILVILCLYALCLLTTWINYANCPQQNFYSTFIQGNTKKHHQEYIQTFHFHEIHVFAWGFMNL